MTRFYAALAAMLLCASGVASAQMTVSGSHVVDSTGTPVANASITFSPTNNAGVPLSFRLGGGGQTVGAPVTTTVTNGAFSISLPDTHLTNPQNVCFAVSVMDNVSGSILPFSGHACVQPGTDSSQSYWCTTSSTCNFDLYTPSNGILTLVTPGPAGQNASVAVGTTTTGTAGSSASVTNSGSSSAAVLNFTVPTGQTGATGSKGDTGTAGTPGQNALVGNLNGDYVDAAVTGPQNGTNTTFTVAQGGYWRVLLNGTRLLPTIDYTQAGTTLTLNFAPTAQDRLTVEAYSQAGSTSIPNSAVLVKDPSGNGQLADSGCTASNGSITCHPADPSSSTSTLYLYGGYYSGMVFGTSSHSGSILFAPDGIGYYDNGTELQKASSGGYRMQIALDVHGHSGSGNYCASGVYFCVDDTLFTVDSSGHAAAVSLSTNTSDTGTTCTVGGYITLVIDGTSRKLAYCN